MRIVLPETMKTGKEIPVWSVKRWTIANSPAMVFYFQS
jgi:hypothetical protein